MKLEELGPWESTIYNIKAYMLKHTLIMSIGTWVCCASSHDVSHSHFGVVLLCRGVLMPLFGLFLWHLIFLSCFWFAYFSPPLVNSVTCCFVDMCLCVTKTLWCIPCRTPREITVMNIHKAICNIPFLDFLTNKHMKILNEEQWNSREDAVGKGNLWPKLGWQIQ